MYWKRMEKIQWDLEKDSELVVEWRNRVIHRKEMGVAELISCDCDELIHRYRRRQNACLPFTERKRKYTLILPKEWGETGAEECPCGLPGSWFILCHVKIKRTRTKSNNQNNQNNATTNAFTTASFLVFCFIYWFFFTDLRTVTLTFRTYTCSNGTAVSLARVSCSSAIEEEEEKKQTLKFIIFLINPISLPNPLCRNPCRNPCVAIIMATHSQPLMLI